MKSTRVWLVAWFSASLVFLFVFFAFITCVHLRHELLKSKPLPSAVVRDEPHVRGSFSEVEISEITRDLFKISIIYSLPLILASLWVGHRLALKSLRPMASINAQLQKVGPRSLSQQITLDEADQECRLLVRHINELLARLDSSFATIAQYSTQVAHELRTPLTILRMKIEHSAGKIDPELGEDLHEELARLSSYVERALLVARAEQGRLLIAPAPFDLAVLVEEVVEDHQLLAEEQNQTVRLSMDRPIWVNAEAGFIRQVLQSMLGNALKHGKGDIYVRLSRRHGAVCLRVFNRKKTDGASSEGSLGMGLRVVRAILEAHGDLSWRVRQDAKNFLIGVRFKEISRPAFAAGALNPPGPVERGDEEVVF